eukprot:GHVT01030907.1.p1 GENE.GHVT01030907.1~~GHVT01030907.1.p1  ORF type:complete len:636 (+),score=27.86 GHVT01030907.1:2548-4455(+)
MTGVTPREGIEKEFEELVLTTIRRSIATGFSQADVDEAINYVEFHVKQSCDGYEKGAAMAALGIGTMLSGKSPFRVFKFQDDLRTIKKQLAAGELVFQNALKRLLANTNRAVVRLVATPEYVYPHLEAEKQSLATAEATMGAADFERIEKDVNELHDRITKMYAENIPTSPPVITLNLLKPPMKFPALLVEGRHLEPTCAGFHTFAYGPISTTPTWDTMPPKYNETIPFDYSLIHHEIYSGGILHFMMGFSLEDVSLDEMFLLELLTLMLTTSGTDEMSPEELSTYIHRYTGGISASFATGNVMCRGMPIDVGASKDSNRITSHRANSAVAYLYLKGMVLEDRIPEFFELATYVMTKANLGSQSMALAILKQIAIDFTFSDNTWKTDKTSAAILATSCVTVRSALDSYISGPNSILKMHELVKEVQTDWPAVEGRLRMLLRRILMSTTASLPTSKTISWPPRVVVDITASSKVLQGARLTGFSDSNPISVAYRKFIRSLQAAADAPGSPPRYKPLMQKWVKNIIESGLLKELNTSYKPLTIIDPFQVFLPAQDKYNYSVPYTRGRTDIVTGATMCKTIADARVSLVGRALLVIYFTENTFSCVDLVLAYDLCACHHPLCLEYHQHYLAHRNPVTA